MRIISVMRHTLVVAVLLAVLSTLSPASAQQARTISVQTGHSLVVDQQAVERVAVGDSNVVSIRAVGEAQLLVTGRAPGHTSAIVWSKRPRMSLTTASSRGSPPLPGPT